MNDDHHSGQARGSDNRLIAMAANLAGAPTAPAAAVRMKVRLDDRVGAANRCTSCMPTPAAGWDAPKPTWAGQSGIVKVKEGV